MNNKAQEKHTPGPWHVPFSHPTIIHNSAGQCIADCDANIHNAQFIVKAVNPGPEIRNAHAAIEKASAQ